MPLYVSSVNDLNLQQNSKNNFEARDEIKTNVKFFFWKNPLAKELLSLDFWISRHFVTILRNKSTFQNATSPKSNWVFQIFFSHLFLSRYPLSKLPICEAISWNLNLAVNLVTQERMSCVKSFCRQKPLKSKNKKHTIVWNTRFCHSANFELKQIKTAKVVSKWPLLASFLPTVSSLIL